MSTRSRSTRPTRSAAANGASSAASQESRSRAASKARSTKKKKGSAGAEDDTSQRAEGARDAAMEEAEPSAGARAALLPIVTSTASGEAALRQELAAMQQIVREQGQRLQQLQGAPEASPVASPQQSPQASPQLSPQPSPLAGSIAAAAASPAATSASLPQPQQQSRFARKEPRAQDLREYDGAPGAKLDEWLQELGRAVRLFRLNDSEAVDFGMSRLTGAALQWSLALDATQQTALVDASALTSALRLRFQPITSDRIAREQLRSLRQGSRPVNDYIADFQRLHARLPDMSAQDALFVFESGVSSAIAMKLREHGCANLADAIALAARIGGIAAAAASTSTNPHGRSAAAGSAANQMEIDEGSSASLDERIHRAVLNAMHSQQASGSGASSSGLGAKTQTQRGYAGERGGGRGGRGGRFGGQPRGPPVVPGVPPEIVRQRLDAQQCVRCGGDGHRSPACPNAISALGN
jgi:hypothetical protein